MSDSELGVVDTSDDIAEISDDKKIRRFFTDRIIRLLMFVAIGIIALLLVITVSFLTYRFMDRGNRSRQFPRLSEDYTTLVPEYSVWTFFADDGYDLRTQTKDAERYTVSARIKLGYDEVRYKELQGELTRKNDVLMDAIRFYFSQRTKIQLEDEVAVKTELLNRINSLLSRGEVAQILFLQYQIIGL